MKRKINQKGAAMLLALFTVIVLASIATGFLAITIAENKTSSSRIDSELALEAATSGIDYLAMVASSQANFWTYGSVNSPGRRGNFSQPNFGNSDFFIRTDDDSDSYYMVYDARNGGANGTTYPNNTIRLCLHDRVGDQTTGKLVGCNIIIHDDPTHYPDIVATSVGYVLNAPGADPNNINIADTKNVFYASRSVQFILKEVSFYNYTYIYKNFTDLDLSFNVPDEYLQEMENMVGLCPNTVINGGIRADGYGDPNTDPNTDRVARLLLWDQDSNPVTTAADKIATINGPVRLVSKDQYDGQTGEGQFVVDRNGTQTYNGKNGYWLNSEMTRAFNGSSTVMGADNRGVPGANEQFMQSVRYATGVTDKDGNIIDNDFNDNSSGTKITAAVGSGSPTDPLSALRINNTQVCIDPETDISKRENLDHSKDEYPDYSKNLCKMTFTTDTNNRTVVQVDIFNRYNEDGPGGKVSGDIDTMISGGETYKVTSSQSFTLNSDAVIYVRGGNTLVEGEIGSGISVICDDSRTEPDNVDGTVDEILPDANTYAYTPDADEGTTEDTNNKKKFFRTLEQDSEEGNPASEGNIFITGDITYQQGTTSAMGLIAENYMYLHELESSDSDQNDDLDYFDDHDTTDYRHLQVNGQLNSIRQSVQFDFFNYLGESRASYLNSKAGAENFNGSIDFKGQMVGNKTDVEGDVKGRGYAYDMSIAYDESLKYYTAPMFFNEDYSQLPAGALQFTVTAFFDKGSLGSK